MLRPISRIQIHSYVFIYIYIYIHIYYTLVQTIISAQAKLEDVRRKHIVHLTGFGADSSTCCKETDNCVHGQARQCSQRQTPFEIYCLPNIPWWVCRKYIGSRWIIGIRDITFSNFIIVTVKYFPTTIDWGWVLTTVHRVSMVAHRSL